MAQYTMYPTNLEYVQAVKTLIVRYPFLKDLEGNGYHTWHMSLRRKFKSERAPLVYNDEVRLSKEKFCRKTSVQSVETARTNLRNLSEASSVLGEDPSSIDAHVKMLHSQYQKMHPDLMIVQDRMQQTFAWRQKEIADGMTVEETVKKYPFLRTPAALYNELEWIHPAIGNVCQRFNEGFSCIVSKVLNLARGKSPLSKLYLEAREEALTEDLPDIDFRAALTFLPHIFKENIDCFITLGERDPATPYPTIQLTDRDWKMAFTRRASNIVKVDGIELCHTSAIDEGIISAFCAYFVFNLAFPRHLKNTLMFLQSIFHHCSSNSGLSGPKQPLTVAQSAATVPPPSRRVSSHTRGQTAAETGAVKPRVSESAFWFLDHRLGVDAHLPEPSDEEVKPAANTPIFAACGGVDPGARDETCSAHASGRRQTCIPLAMAPGGSNAKHKARSAQISLRLKYGARHRQRIIQWEPTFAF
uniref:Sterile alpha motif domain-containing protein 3-like n=1 Tax=Knipowitschia caucasica TaxID=637954 RepID=A0AAV2L6Z8_KNICA